MLVGFCQQIYFLRQPKKYNVEFILNDQILKIIPIYKHDF